MDGKSAASAVNEGARMHKIMPVLPAAKAGTVTLGDVIINRMGFGAMHMAGRDAWGNPPNVDLCKQVLKRAIELGVSFVDTADAYGPGVSEKLIRQTLYPYGEVVVATKGGFLRPSSDDWRIDAKPTHLKQAAAASCERLKLASLPLYQLNIVDPEASLATSVGALRELQESGIVQHIGLCNVTLEQLQEAEKIAPIASVQNLYNVQHRAESEAIMRYCETQGIVFISYFPMGGGKTSLDHPYLQRVAQKYGASTRQIALAWLLHHSPNIVVIPGTASIPHLEANIEAAEISLDASDMALLDKLTDAPNP